MSQKSSFRRVFKRATGIAPNQYRQRFRWIAFPRDDPDEQRPL
jgi:AraC-like DNA-binding protein